MTPLLRPPSLKCIVAVDLLGNTLRRAVFANVVSSDSIMRHLETVGRWTTSDAAYIMLFMLCVARYAADEGRLTKYKKLRRDFAVSREVLFRGAEFFLLVGVLVLTRDVGSCT